MSNMEKLLKERDKLQIQLNVIQQEMEHLNAKYHSVSEQIFEIDNQINKGVCRTYKIFIKKDDEDEDLRD